MRRLRAANLWLTALHYDTLEAVYCQRDAPALRQVSPTSQQSEAPCGSASIVHVRLNTAVAIVCISMEPWELIDVRVSGLLPHSGNERTFGGYVTHPAGARSGTCDVQGRKRTLLQVGMVDALSTPRDARSNRPRGTGMVTGPRSFAPVADLRSARRSRTMGQVKAAIVALFEGVLSMARTLNPVSAPSPSANAGAAGNRASAPSDQSRPADYDDYRLSQEISGRATRDLAEQLKRGF